MDKITVGIGTRTYPSEFKIEVVERKTKDSLTWSQLQQTIEKELGIFIPLGTLGTWNSWYRDLSNNTATLQGDSKLAGKGVPWRLEEDDFLREAVDIGLPSSEIAVLMQETPELNYRNYTKRSIECRMLRLNIRSNYMGFKQKSKKVSPAVVENIQNLLADVNQTLIKYSNAQYVEVECNVCKYRWSKSSINIKHFIGCVMCVIPSNSYQEVYIVEFSDFGNPSVKVGISLSYLEKRKATFPQHTVVAVYKTTFKKAKEIEILIAEKFGEYRTTPPELHNNGSTECYDISITNKINKTIKEQLHG